MILVHHSGVVREFADILDALSYARVHWPARVTREDGALLAETGASVHQLTCGDAGMPWGLAVAYTAQSVGWN